MKARLPQGFGKPDVNALMRQAQKMQEEMKPQALKRIQTRLVLEKIAETENIEVSEDEVNEEISKMAEMYKMEIGRAHV